MAWNTNDVLAATRAAVPAPPADCTPSECALAGSPSSYAWVLCVIHFLQTTTPPILPVLQQLYGPNAQSDYAPSTIVRIVSATRY